MQSDELAVLRERGVRPDGRLVVLDAVAVSVHAAAGGERAVERALERHF